MNTIKNSRCLITGGFGFIGLHLAKSLKELGNECNLLDVADPSLSSAEEMGLLDEEQIIFIKGNILDIPFVNSLADDFDYIIHAAGVLGIKTVNDHPFLTADVNVFGTRNILDFAKRQKNLKRFLYFSTSEIYGIEAKNSKEIDPAVIPSDGNRWIYASSKSFAEHLTKSYQTEFGLPTSIIRPFNVYGPHRKGGNAMTSFIEKAMAGEEIFIHGTGEQIRSWCHIDDFVDGTLKAISVESGLGETFNLGNDAEPISIFNLADRICKQLDSASKITILYDHSHDVQNRCPNIEKARSMLSYEPKIALDEGILSTVKACQLRSNV